MWVHQRGTSALNEQYTCKCPFPAPRNRVHLRWHLDGARSNLCTRCLDWDHMILGCSKSVLIHHALPFWGVGSHSIYPYTQGSGGVLAAKVIVLAWYWRDHVGQKQFLYCHFWGWGPSSNTFWNDKTLSSIFIYITFLGNNWDKRFRYKY